MEDRPDIFIVQPPRPDWVLRSVAGTGASRQVPAQEAVDVANSLRVRGYRAVALNADLYSEVDFCKVLEQLCKRTKILAFFLRAYRLPVTYRVVRWLCSVPPAARTVALGFLPRDFEQHPYCAIFDSFIPGPGWSLGLEDMLRGCGVGRSRPLPRIVELGSFEELTDTPGLTACITAPTILCRYNCRFCEHQILKGSPKAAQALVPRPVNEILDEIAVAWDEGARSAVFLEGNFCSYPEWTRNFAVRLGEAFSAIRFAISTRLTDIAPAELDGNLRRLIRAGLVSVCSGLESGDDEILSHINKRATVAQYIQGDSILKRHGLKRFYSIILGLPGETLDTVDRTVNLVRKLSPDGLQVSIAVPLPGTPMYGEAERQGWLTSQNLDRYYYYGGSIVMEHGLKAEELIAFQESICYEFDRQPVCKV